MFMSDIYQVLILFLVVLRTVYSIFSGESFSKNDYYGQDLILIFFLSTIPFILSFITTIADKINGY